jgi:hypothetical protein
MLDPLNLYSPIPPTLLESLKACISKPRTLLNKDSVLVLVCGAKHVDGVTSGREYVLEYGKRHLTHLRFFESEKVFAALSKHEQDLLSIEDKLAAFSDCVMIILESPGALAEVGAFAIKDELAKIVLVINEEKFRRDNSFVNLGPITKIEKQSKFGKVVYVDFANILIAAPEITNRLRLIERKRSRAVDFRSFELFRQKEPKLRMLLLADLIALFSPLAFQDLLNLLKGIFGENHFDIDLELSMLFALGLVVKSGAFYWRSLKDRGLFFRFAGLNETVMRCQLINHYHKYFPERTDVLKSMATG